uniref:Uncharacterized protein n=1 Tax=Arundo donax TaxID=35708 RepID=A0A0A8Z4J3_ARUDO
MHGLLKWLDEVVLIEASPNTSRWTGETSSWS